MARQRRLGSKIDERIKHERTNDRRAMARNSQGSRLKDRPDTAEVTWSYVQILDPYGKLPICPKSATKLEEDTLLARLAVASGFRFTICHRRSGTHCGNGTNPNWDSPPDYLSSAVVKTGPNDVVGGHDGA